MSRCPALTFTAVLLPTSSLVTLLLQSRSPELTQAVTRERSRMAAKLYLVAYNTAQCLGWTYLAYQMAAHLAGGGSLDTLYAATATTLQIFQVMTVQCWEWTGGFLGVSGLTVSLVTDGSPARDSTRRSGPGQVQRAGHSAASLVQVSPALVHLVQYNNIPIYQD